MNAKYDSTAETEAHIVQVQDNMRDILKNLAQRSVFHDQSKLLPPEKEMFDEVTSKLHGLTYGSDEYKQSLADLKPALDHHYAHNTHHPEHYENGYRGMSLLDVIEMLVDWYAATKRHADGDLAKSIEINAKRFGYGDDLKGILQNTARELGWIA